MNEVQYDHYRRLILSIKQGGHYPTIRVQFNQDEANLFLVAAAELKRLRAILSRVEDVEGMAKAIYRHIHGGEMDESIVPGMTRKMQFLSRAVRDFIKEG